MKWWILYCAMQAVPAQDPTEHLVFDAQDRCLHQAEISNSFGELHCVCAEGSGPKPFGEPYRPFMPL
jgi:hypothetical protein